VQKIRSGGTWRQRTVGVVLACGAMTALGLGIAAPANAATLGRVSVSTSENAFPSKTPSWEQVERATKQAGLNACKNVYGGTKRVLLNNFHKEGSFIVSTWWCQS
jgi:hypothetical protein